MAYDPHSLFAYTTIVSVTSQAANTLVVVVTTGDGARFAVGQQVTAAPPATPALYSNAMVGRITVIAGDTLTIDYSSGNREGSQVQTILAGYVIGNGVTPKVLTDIETAVNTNTTAITTGLAKALKSATTSIDVSAATAPTAGQILTAVSPTIATWQTLSTALDGWTADANTWTYASASTFTITGDQTSIYRIGTLLKFTQSGTVKYGVVASSSYSNPTTTVTIMVNTDYVIANSAISATYYSYQANPQGFPSFFNWTPTQTGFSVAPTVSVSTISVTGRLATVIIYTAGGGTSNSTTLTISNLPLQAAQTSWGFAWVTDNGSNNYGNVRTSTGGSVLTVGLTIGIFNWTATGTKSLNATQITYPF